MTVSEEEAIKVAREMAEELGLVVGPKSRIYHSCGRVIMVKDWPAHQVRRLLTSRCDLGYVSVKGFVEDAFRRRLEEIGGERQ